MHLPCFVFSCKQLDLFLWLLWVNNVDNVPSTKSLNLLNKILQNSCGIDKLVYEGKLGHHYHVNSMAQILAQVLCFHLHFHVPTCSEVQLRRLYDVIHISASLAISGFWPTFWVFGMSPAFTTLPWIASEFSLQVAVCLQTWAPKDHPLPCSQYALHPLLFHLNCF